MMAGSMKRVRGERGRVRGHVLGSGRVPLLDLMEAREERDGNEDDDCFFAMTDFDLEIFY